MEYANLIDGTFVSLNLEAIPLDRSKLPSDAKCFVIAKVPVFAGVRLKHNFHIGGVINANTELSITSVEKRIFNVSLLSGVNIDILKRRHLCFSWTSSVGVYSTSMFGQVMFAGAIEDYFYFVTSFIHKSSFNFLIFNLLDISISSSVPIIGRLDNIDFQKFMDSISTDTDKRSLLLILNIFPIFKMFLHLVGCIRYKDFNCFSIHSRNSQCIDDRIATITASSFYSLNIGFKVRTLLTIIQKTKEKVYEEMSRRRSNIDLVKQDVKPVKEKIEEVADKKLLPKTISTRDIDDSFRII